MDYVLNDFVAMLRRQGLARPNRFHANIHLPKALGDVLARQRGDARYDAQRGGAEPSANTVNAGGGLSSSRQLSIALQSVTMPGLNLSTNDSNVGYKRKVVYDAQRTDADCSFICTGNMLEKKILDEWTSLIVDNEHRIEYYDNYVGTAEILMYLEGSEDVRYRLQLTEFFPTAVNPLSLDRSSQNTFGNLSVGFSFRRAVNMDPSVTVKTATAAAVDTNSVVAANTDTSSTGARLSLANMESNSEVPQDLVNSSNRVKGQIENGMNPEDANILINQMERAAQTNPRLSPVAKSAVSDYAKLLRANAPK